MGHHVDVPVHGHTLSLCRWMPESTSGTFLAQEPAFRSQLALFLPPFIGLMSAVGVGGGLVLSTRRLPLRALLFLLVAVLDLAQLFLVLVGAATVR